MAARQRPVGQLALDRRPRDERDAVAGRDGALHRFLQPELELRLEVAHPQPRGAQLLLDHVADAGALLHRDVLLARQLLGRHLLARERVVGRDGEDDLVAHERLELERAMTAKRTHDAQLELALADLLDHAVRVRDRQRHREVGVARAGTRRAGAGRGVRPARSRRRSPACRAARPSPPARAPRSSCCSIWSIRCARLYRTRPASVGSTRRPERSSKRPAEALLERPDLQADRRLRHPEPLGRLREALLLDHRDEGRELPRIHKHSLWTA